MMRPGLIIVHLGLGGGPATGDRLWLYDSGTPVRVPRSQVTSAAGENLRVRLPGQVYHGRFRARLATSAERSGYRHWEREQRAAGAWVPEYA